MNTKGYTDFYKTMQKVYENSDRAIYVDGLNREQYNRAWQMLCVIKDSPLVDKLGDVAMSIAKRAMPPKKVLVPPQLYKDISELFSPWCEVLEHPVIHDDKIVLIWDEFNLGTADYVVPIITPFDMA